MGPPWAFWKHGVTPVVARWESTARMRVQISKTTHYSKREASQMLPRQNCEESRMSNSTLLSWLDQEVFAERLHAQLQYGPPCCKGRRREAAAEMQRGNAGTDGGQKTGLLCIEQMAVSAQCGLQHTVTPALSHTGLLFIQFVNWAHCIYDMINVSHCNLVMSFHDIIIGADFYLLCFFLYIFSHCAFCFKFLWVSKKDSCFHSSGLTLYLNLFIAFGHFFLI